MADNLLANIDNPNATVTGLEDTLDEFISDLFNKPHIEYATFTFPVEAIDPLAYLEMCWQKHAFQYYWEKPSDEFAIAAGGELLTVTASGKDRFQQTNEKIDSISESIAEYKQISHPYAGVMFLGGFSFDDHLSDGIWNSFHPASFTIPKWMIIKDGKFNLATLSVSLKSFDTGQELQQYLLEELVKINEIVQGHHPKNEAKYSEISANFSADTNGRSAYNNWISSVQKAKNLIKENKFDKIVLARQISIPTNKNIAPTQVLNILRQQYSNCYNFLFHQPENETFLGSTPERLGSFRNNLLLTEALAGSIRRGKTATEDSILEKDLSTSLKDRSEHNYVVKDIEERLKPYVKKVDRSKQPEIKKLTNVQHLYTPIRAKLKKGSNILTVLQSLHPTPAVGGYPWQNASDHIDDLEHFERGWYAGPVGWLNTKGGGEFAVGIRSGLLTEEETHFFAGCGIVADSDPSAEWEETNLKLKPMLSALQYD